jgi:orotate phosphoribosyltransferase
LASRERYLSLVTDVSQSDPREELRQLLIQKSVCQGDFTLASGAKSDFYVDARVTTLDPRGATLIGKVGWNLLRKTASELGYKVDAVGGLTMGADPIALSIGVTAYADNPEAFPQVFTVRKKVKEHGRHKLIEGNFAKGNSVVIIEDVITTGGSAMQAIDAVESEGGRVAFVVALVDRQEGGRAAIEARGHKVVAIFTRADLLDARERADRATA